MRILLTVGILALVVLGADAQKQIKPNINKAKMMWEKGDLPGAQEMIDAATTYEKTMNDGKTWYYRGLIYASIDTTSNADHRALSNNAMEVALESFAKAESMDDGKGYALISTFGIATLDQQLNGWYGHYFNEAVLSYEAEDFETAIDKFMSAAKIMPTDTNSVQNAAYAAINGENNEKALELLQETVNRGSKNLNIYLNIVQLHMTNENLEKALEVTRQAKKVFPTNNMLNRQEVDLLRKLGKLDEAIEQLKIAISNEPDNALLPFFLGILYEEAEDEANAIVWYDKAIEVDPTYYDAAFNKAAMQYNKGTEIQKEKNLLGYSKEDQKKAKELEPKIKQAFADAIPAWEKLYEIRPKERDVLERLIYMYDLTGQSTKADKMEKELNALPSED